MAYFNIEGYNSYSGCDILVTATLPSINGSEASGKFYTLGSLQTLSISTHQDKRPVRSLGVINAKDYVMGPRTIAGSMVFAVFNKHFASEIMADLGASGSSVVLPDEIPALNITINFANEYGRRSRMAIFGVKIINEGQVMSINDLYTENTYQFVALGLEPLNINIDSTNEEVAKSASNLNNKTITSEDIITSETEEMADALLADIEFNNNSGTNLVTQIQNNPYKNNSEYNDTDILNSLGAIELRVEVEHAKDESNMGLASFTITPKQNNGVIYIYKYGSLSKVMYNLNIEQKVNYIISIPAGSYTAQFINVANEASNSVNFNIDSYNQYSSDDYYKVYPIIESVTHNSIQVSSSEYTHNQVCYYKEGDAGNIKKVDIGKTAVTLSNLLVNTEYCIYTTSSTSRSETIIVKTHSIENEELQTLIQFIKDNERLLASDYNELIDLINLIDISKYNNLLDSILSLPESNAKQELLIYANKLANHYIISYNNMNDKHITNEIKDTPFDSVIKVDGYNQANFYSTYNNKITFAESINPTEENFYAVPNKHYFVQGIDDGIKSVKQDFVVCRNNAFSFLQRYCDYDNYKELSLDSYLTQYSKNSYDIIEALAIKNSFFSDVEVLPSPYVYQDELNDIYINVDYHILKPNEDYYLSYIEIHDALDYVPVRKIKFTSETDIINLKNYYPGILSNNKYLFWIENKDYVKLSKPELFIHNTDARYKEYVEIYEMDTYRLINTIKNIYLKVYNNKQVVNELFNYVQNLHPCNKDIVYTLYMYCVELFGSSLYVSNMFDALYNLISITHDSINANIDYSIEINVSRNILKVDISDDFYVCAIYINNDTIKNLNVYENMVSYPTDGYTMVYVISNNLLFKSDFVLINNSSGEIKYSESMKNIIKKVGDY